MSLNTSGRRDYFFVFLAIVSFIADAYTLYQFVNDRTVLAFWTFQWVISILLVALLAAGGFLFLKLSGSHEAARAILLIFGILYTLASIIVYLYWGYHQVNGGMTFGDYAGFLVLFVILCGVGLFGVGYKVPESLRLPSYAYALASLIYVFLLVQKYVVQGHSFAFWRFLGELLLLAVGVVLFMGLVIFAE